MKIKKFNEIHHSDDNDEQIKDKKWCEKALPVVNDILKDYRDELSLKVSLYRNGGDGYDYVIKSWIKSYDTAKDIQKLLKDNDISSYIDRISDTTQEFIIYPGSEEIKLKKFNEFFFNSEESEELNDRFPADDEQQEVDSMCTSCGCDCATGDCTCDDCDCEACCNKCCDDDQDDDITSFSDYRRMSTNKPVERRRVIGDEVVEKKKFNFDKKKGDKKEEKSDKKEDKKETKGLSASQKKLPAGLQKAILAKKKK